MLQRLGTVGGAFICGLFLVGCGDAGPTQQSPSADRVDPATVSALEEELSALTERLNSLEEMVSAIVEQVGATREAITAPTETAARTTPTHEPMVMGAEAVQEIGLIENYRATQFFPRWMVVLKDVPVRIYLTRLHKEHVNKFNIDPFYSSSEVILPGEIGVIEFVPDQVGEFKIRNVGHNFEADLVVVETEEEAKKLKLERGGQMFALIHSVDDFRIFPDTLVMQDGIPATIHNISLVTEHQVSVEPFYSPEDLNVKPREIFRFEFTPDQTGEFTIRHEIHGFTGRLVVEEAE